MDSAVYFIGQLAGHFLPGEDFFGESTVRTLGVLHPTAGVLQCKISMKSCFALFLARRGVMSLCPSQWLQKQGANESLAPKESRCIGGVGEARVATDGMAGYVRPGKRLGSFPILHFPIHRARPCD